ncbi:low molecular weight protein-tyrosine-phosphatase [Virgibacillus xinjiangensis]|uniref:protein-tyrosine-phosphatase n=1 Tax=Virgibacillus xinjiangensis TaxID=393090 RepID=A0ABV7CYP9_9BACI
MIKVLFVCLGNICRSPMAEAVFRDMINKENLEGEIEIDSSGISDTHAGSRPHQGTRNLLDQNNISYEGILSRQIEDRDWERFDYIIAMDEENVSDLRSLDRQTEGTVVKKLMDFVEEPQDVNVPDPYYTGNFDYTYQLVQEGCSQFLSFLKEKHDL